MDSKDKNLTPALDEFLGLESEELELNQEKVVKRDKSILEKINKKVITEDGRQLL